MGAKMNPKIVENLASAPHGRPEASRERFWSHFGCLLDPREPKKHVKYLFLALESLEKHIKYEGLARGGPKTK